MHPMPRQPLIDCYNKTGHMLRDDMLKGSRVETRSARNGKVAALFPRLHRLFDDKLHHAFGETTWVKDTMRITQTEVTELWQGQGQDSPCPRERLNSVKLGADLPSLAPTILE